MAPGFSFNQGLPPTTTTNTLQNQGMYNPFTNFKQTTMTNNASSASSRMSASKIKHLNSTIQHIRSLSNYHK